MPVGYQTPMNWGRELGNGPQTYDCDTDLGVFIVHCLKPEDADRSRHEKRSHQYPHIPHKQLAVLAAGVGNDVVSWILLALALVNLTGGLTGLYALLVGIGHCHLHLPTRQVGLQIFAHQVHKLGNRPTHDVLS
ncbi:hypothetical protein BJ322DRAFT_754682 [Thelephora terrestris]|uniref:Uncharacterized protein n=1 Tax=Thelephora terrestris TaxID=56493 RepID=A0A9P6HH73_9AGAM|nr:hypothetical protein BJ322DRAFT_754682 [Thelephora terrestris]